MRPENSSRDFFEEGSRSDSLPTKARDLNVKSDEALYVNIETRGTMIVRFLSQLRLQGFDVHSTHFEVLYRLLEIADGDEIQCDRFIAEVNYKYLAIVLGREETKGTYGHLARVIGELVKAGIATPISKSKLELKIPGTSPEQKVRADDALDPRNLLASAENEAQGIIGAQNDLRTDDASGIKNDASGIIGARNQNSKMRTNDASGTFCAQNPTKMRTDDASGTFCAQNQVKKPDMYVHGNDYDMYMSERDGAGGRGEAEEEKKTDRSQDRHQQKICMAMLKAIKFGDKGFDPGGIRAMLKMPTCTPDRIQLVEEITRHEFAVGSVKNPCGYFFNLVKKPHVRNAPHDQAVAAMGEAESDFAGAAMEAELAEAKAAIRKKYAGESQKQSQQSVIDKNLAHAQALAAERAAKIAAAAEGNAKIAEAVKSQDDNKIVAAVLAKQTAVKAGGAPAEKSFKEIAEEQIARLMALKPTAKQEVQS